VAVRLVLASASPRRREILSYLQIPYDVQPANVDETAHAGERPAELVRRLSRAKAAALSATCPRQEAAGRPDTLILAADTTVALDGVVIGKPKDAAEAEEILKRLRGRVHQVFTGLTLVPPGANGHAQSGAWSALCETRVQLRNYGDDELLAYVGAGEVYDKAGAYAIQDVAFHPVERIEGCYMNVMGLPLCEVIRGLRALGVETDKAEPIRHDCLNAKGRPCWLSDDKG
jgi:septum formation protein